MTNGLVQCGCVFEVDFALAKVSTQCDSCKQSIDTSKPKPNKNDKNSKSKINPAIKATLETGVDTGETNEYHFCYELCLREFLNRRYKTK